MPHPYEWVALRVVPRVDRGEFVNAGVVLYCQRLEFLQARIAPSLDRALALDPSLDVLALARHLEAVRRVCDGDPAGGDASGRPAGERYRWLVAPRSTVVQTSPVHTGLTANPEEDLLRLFQCMVATGTG